MKQSQIEANSEARRVFELQRQDIPADLRDLPAHTLRDRILKAIAPLDGGILYDPEAMQLVAAFEAALRRAWEEGERGFVRQRAFDSVRNALEAVSEGRLL